MKIMLGDLFSNTVNVWNTHSGSYVNCQPLPFTVEGLSKRAKGPVQLNDCFVQPYLIHVYVGYNVT